MEKLFIIIIYYYYEDGDVRSPVVIASEFKSEDHGFDPLVDQCEGHIFCPADSTFVQTCLCLTALRVYTTRTQMCAHVKDPIYSCCKRVDLTAGGTITQKILPTLG